MRQNPKHTLALIVTWQKSGPELLEILSQESEIQYFETLLSRDAQEPLLELHAKRVAEKQSEDDFANYVENLLCKPSTKREVKEQAIQWFQSKIKIENYEREERQAVAVVAKVALELYRQNPTQLDFVLSSHRSEILVRIFNLKEDARRLLAS